MKYYSIEEIKKKEHKKKYNNIYIYRSWIQTINKIREIYQISTYIINVHLNIK